MKYDKVHSILTLTPMETIKYLYDILCKKYGKPKALAISTSMISILETSLFRPRSNYLIDIKGNTVTGEVYLLVSDKYSHAGVEAKVTVKHLKYTRWLPWFDYQVKVK